MVDFCMKMSTFQWKIYQTNLEHKHNLIVCVLFTLQVYTVKNNCYLSSWGRDIIAILSVPRFRFQNVKLLLFCLNKYTHLSIEIIKLLKVSDIFFHTFLFYFLLYFSILFLYRETCRNQNTFLTEIYNGKTWCLLSIRKFFGLSTNYISI